MFRFSSVLERSPFLSILMKFSFRTCTARAFDVTFSLRVKKARSQSERGAERERATFRVHHRHFRLEHREFKAFCIPSSVALGPPVAKESA
jgi:hypothetical protein